MKFLDYLFHGKELRYIDSYFKMLNGYSPTFTSYNGGVYEMDLTRTAVNSFATHCSKLKPEIEGSALKSLEKTLQHKPNYFMDTTKFIKRMATYVAVEHTAFIIPIEDEYGRLCGWYPLRAQRCEVVEAAGQVYLRYLFANGEYGAIEFERVGIMTDFEYTDDLFGEDNRTLKPTMQLIHTQNEGIINAVKNSANIRFLAKVANMLKPEDIKKERHPLPGEVARRRRDVFRLMSKHGFTPDFQSSKRLSSSQELYDFFTNTLSDFENAGTVLIGQELRDLRVEQSPQVQVERQGNLLDISFDFSSLDDEDVDHALAALMESSPYFINRSGQLIVFDEATHRISESLKTLRARYSGKGHLELNQLTAYQLMDALSESDSVRFSKDFQLLTQHLSKPDTFDLPTYKVEAGLRPYQERGVQWLSMLHHYGFGGILADDMGLGKTLQTIAYLSAHLEE